MGNSQNNSKQPNNSKDLKDNKGNTVSDLKSSQKVTL
jgi:hypothetical protein